MLVDKPMFKVKTNIMTLRIFKVKKKTKTKEKKTTEKMSLWTHATHCFSVSILNFEHLKNSKVDQLIDTSI